MTKDKMNELRGLLILIWACVTPSESMRAAMSLFGAVLLIVALVQRLRNTP